METQYVFEDGLIVGCPVMPLLMLTYRAAAWWQRAYCPEISMGFMTREEVDDIQDADYTDLTNKDKLDMIAEQTATEYNEQPQGKTEPAANEGKLL